MSVHQEQTSEVARLLAQIDKEYETAQLGLYGLSQGSSQHQFMNAITERIGRLYAQLHDLISEETIASVSVQTDLTSKGGVMKEEKKEGQ